MYDKSCMYGACGTGLGAQQTPAALPLTMLAFGGLVVFGAWAMLKRKRRARY